MTTINLQFLFRYISFVFDFIGVFNILFYFIYLFDFIGVFYYFIFCSFADLFATPTDLNNLVISMLFGKSKVILRLYQCSGEDNNSDGSHLGSSGTNVHISVLETVGIFVSKVAELRRMDRITGVPVDKQNVHRIFELVYHKLPAYGHARLLSQMHLEYFHQILKRSNEK